MQGSSHNASARTTVIIVAYHGDRWMPDCVASLAVSTGVPCRIVVVDNIGNTALGKLDTGRHVHEIRKCPEPLGFAEANNYAMVSGGLQDEYVCFLNQDTLSRLGWLDACVQLLHENPQIGAVTPLMATYDGVGWDPNFLDCVRKAPELHTRLTTGEALRPFYATSVIPAAAMVARSEVIRQVGPFDPIYVSYCEDYDLCQRIRKAGYQVGVCTGGTICHYSGSATFSPEAERRRRRLITRNRTIYMLRHRGGSRQASLVDYLLCHFFRNMLRSLLRRPTTQSLPDFLASHWDLMPLVWRLLSARHDKQCWAAYLQRIGW